MSERGDGRNWETGTDAYSLTDPMDKIDNFENIRYSTGIVLCIK